MVLSGAAKMKTLSLGADEWDQVEVIEMTSSGTFLFARHTERMLQRYLSGPTWMLIMLIMLITLR